MTNLFVLMLLYLVYFAISLWLFNCNFLSPSFVFSASLSIMLCFAYYAATNLDMLFAINIETFTIFAWAGFIFLATEFLVYAAQTVNNLNNPPLKTPGQPQPLIIDPQIQWAATIFLALSLLIAVAVVLINTGGGSWNARMVAYKNMLLHDTFSLRYRFIPAQLYKVNIVIADLFGYVLVYNMTVCNVPMRKMLLYAADVLLYVLFSSVYTAARQSAIEVFLVLGMIYIAVNMKPGGKRKVIGLIVKSLPVVAVAGGLFTFAGPLVGRYETTKSSLQNFLEYLCGGLYAFNVRIDQAASTKLWGQSSFTFIYMIPQNLGLIPPVENEVGFGEFYLYGNTVSFFGRWYIDFGTTGVFIMTCLVSLCFSLFFYKKIIHSRNIMRENHVARIIYCQLMTAIVWSGYDDRISAIFTLQVLTFLIFTAVFYKMLILDKFKLF